VCRERYFRIRRKRKGHEETGDDTKEGKAKNKKRRWRWG
jgi:hypothetical protein